MKKKILLTLSHILVAALAAAVTLAVAVPKSEVSKLEELESLRRSQHVFRPQREEAACAADYRQWRRAVERSRMWIENEL